MNYLEILDSYKDEMLNTLAESVAFNTVQRPASKNENGEICPYGAETVDCLKHILGKGLELGFDSMNLDNYAGHIEWKAEAAEEYVYVAGHLDVVPAGDVGWDNDPFTMVQKDGYVYGRGVSDDKGPMIAALYAMKALKESGFKPSKNIRMVFATDEEVGVESIDYYVERMGHPVSGFTPDSDFPLTNGEMGVLTFDLDEKLKPATTKEGLRLTKFEAGTAPNAVPALAKAVVASQDAAAYELVKEKIAQYEEKSGFKLKAKRSGSSLVIEAFGKAAHGAHPWDGINAISILMGFLGMLEFNSDEVNEFIDFYNDKIGFCLDGEKIGCAMEDEASGKLIFNVGMARISEELASVTINLRYPVTHTGDEVYAGIEAKLAGKKIGIIKRAEAKPIFMEPDNDIVLDMMEAYREETGDTEAKPSVSSGGTYAKEVNNILAFGGLFPGEEDTMHQANEKMSIDSFMKMARIYARALYKLAGE